MRRRSDIIVIILLLSVPFSGRTALAKDPRQVIVARVANDTTAWIEHGVGDSTALLHVENATPRLERTLARQTGRWCPSVSRRQQTGTITTYLLTLENSRIVPRVRFGRRPRTLRVEFRAYERPRLPRSDRLIGRIAGLGGRKTSNVGGLPPRVLAPRCTSDPGPCTHFETARDAARALALGDSVKHLEAWAFRFQTEKPWLRARAPFAFTTLAAVQVLIQGGVLPEAEILLTSREGLRGPRFAPYTALALAEVFDRTDRHEEAQTIRDSVVENVKNGGLQSRALLASLRADIEQRRFVDAADRVERLPMLAVKSDDARAEAWALAAEVALALGDTEGAYARYHQARGFARDDVLKASIELRLGDLDLLPAGHPENVDRHYLAARSGDACTLERLQLRRMLRKNEVAEDTLAQRVEGIAEEGQCFPVRIEAHYAAAFMASADGQDARAIDVLELGRETARIAGDDAWAVDAALLDATRSILDTWTDRLWRGQRWGELIDLFDGRLAPYRTLLTPRATLRLSEAYRQMHAPSAVSQELLSHIRSGSGELEDRLLAELADSYRNDGDDLRADVTARFIVERGTPSTWRARLLLAEMKLDAGNAAAAMGHLDDARNTTPEGDERQRWRRLRASALNRLDKPNDAATTLLTWLDGTPTPSARHRATVVNVTSACVRLCNRSLLERLLKRIETFDDGAVLTERTRVLANQRGIVLGKAAEETKEDGVWKRFDRAIAKSERR